MNNKEILFSLDAVDEKYLEEARPMRKRNGLIKTITVAASLTIVFGLSLGIMLGNLSGNPNIPNDLYSDLCAGDNYSRLTAILKDFGENSSTHTLQDDFWLGDADDIYPEGSGPNFDDAPDGDAMGNGSYINVAENQVKGVDEPDIFKMTDKYIFRIGGVKAGGEALRIYTLDGDNSKQVGEFIIPYFDGNKYSVGAEMFLSNNGNTVTIIKSFYAEEEYYAIAKTVLMLVDVSDVTSPKLIKHVAFNGSYDFIRNTNGKLVLGTMFSTNSYRFDWSDPQKYLPYYEGGEGRKYLSPEDIICPDKIYRRSYSSFFLLDENLNVTSSKAVFGITGISYVSENKIVTSVGYANNRVEAIALKDVGCKTDFAVIDYSSGELKMQSILTADGWISDRFFIDEKDEYLRVITNDYTMTNTAVSTNSSSLYVFDLRDCSTVASVKDFSPKGESATAVRFEGNKLYVCTAEITIERICDPVYFFDLSNYNNIRQVNTGFIDGFSSALITFGDGYLLGIGSLDNETNKVSVYKRKGNSVVIVAEYFFKGVHSSDRKAFIIDKEKGIFGFTSGAYYDQKNNEIVIGSYHLLHFDGESLTEIHTVADLNHNVHTIRAVYYNGYLYLTKNMDIIVEKID